MATTDNYQKSAVNSSDEDLVQVPVRINPETADEFRADHPDIPLRMWRIGGKKYLCAIYQLPKGQADDFLRMQQTDSKREQREARCLLPSTDGGYIRCPETNKCCKCVRFTSWQFDNLHPTSLDFLLGHSNYEPETGVELENAFDIDGGEDQNTETDAYEEIYHMLVERLAQIKPRYGQIFTELYNGNVRPLNIAKVLGLGKSQCYTDTEQVRKLAKKIYFELVGN